MSRTGGGVSRLNGRTPRVRAHAHGVASNSAPHRWFRGTIPERVLNDNYTSPAHCRISFVTFGRSLPHHAATGVDGGGGVAAISGGARRELVKAVGERYRSRTREQKGRTLDAFDAVTAWHRKHAIRVLNVAGASVDRLVKPHKRLYDDAIQRALLVLWEASDRICSKRLRPLLPSLVAALEQHGHLRLDDGIKIRVLSVSAATIDRLLAVPRAAARGVVGRGARPIRQWGQGERLRWRNAHSARRGTASGRRFRFL